MLVNQSTIPSLISMDKPCKLSKNVPNPNGYASKVIKGKRYLHHRLVWEMAFGPIPDGLFVCHRCDVRNCIEITHLFLGTSNDNVQDMINKGRQSKRLTEEEVLDIKKKEESVEVLAKKYHITETHVRYIWQGKVWRWL